MRSISLCFCLFVNSTTSATQHDLGPLKRATEASIAKHNSQLEPKGSYNSILEASMAAMDLQFDLIAQIGMDWEFLPALIERVIGRDTEACNGLIAAARSLLEELPKYTAAISTLKQPLSYLKMAEFVEAVTLTDHQRLAGTDMLAGRAMQCHSDLSELAQLRVVCAEAFAHRQFVLYEDFRILAENAGEGSKTPYMWIDWQYSDEEYDSGNGDIGIVSSDDADDLHAIAERPLSGTPIHDDEPIQQIDRASDDEDVFV